MKIPAAAHALMPALKYVPLTGAPQPAYRQLSARTGATADSTAMTTAPAPAASQPSMLMSVLPTIGYVGSLAGTGLGAYHGYKRNDDSIGWGVGWALLGTFWPITLPIMFAQGFGEPKKR